MKLILLILLWIVELPSQSSGEDNHKHRDKRVKREPLQRSGLSLGRSGLSLQRDEAMEEATNRVDIEDGVKMTLRPQGQVTVQEGGMVQFECEIRNKPEGGQVQWYYILRGGDDGSRFDNFTIIANEVATVDNSKYHVWTTPPSTYYLQMQELTKADAGEYCCFLYMSYSQTYRRITQVLVVPGKQGKYSRRVSPEANGENSKLEEIIEEAVEHDIEEELGETLNMTLVKHNEEARNLIHNATEQIKRLLDLDDSELLGFNNHSTKLIITQKMKGMKSQVKTVVTTLLRKISSVNTAQDPSRDQLVELGGSLRNSVSYAGRQANGGIRDWRALYNEYRQQRRKTDHGSHQTGQRSHQTGRSRQEISRSSQRTAPPGGKTGNNVPRPITANVAQNRIELEREENEVTVESNGVESNGVESNGVESNGVESNGEETRLEQSAVEPSVTDKKKCEYQLVINEFDPSQCPSINGGRPSHAAAMYYEADNREMLESRLESATPVSNQQLTRIEDRLMDEMVNNKMVNKTIKMHDDMLHKTEKVLEEQTGNLTKLENLVVELRTKLQRSEEDKESMDKKLTQVMINMLEVNKRLDVAMKRPVSQPYGKVIGVETASGTIRCDKHPNVTHYTDCADVLAEGNTASGIYYIKLIYSACPIPVWCDMDTYPGGWTVLQRRDGGKIQFNRNWIEYRKGFGEVTGEHWLGNDNIFLLSNQKKYRLRVDLWDFYNSRVFAEYKTFRIDGERDSYKLHIANYSGTAGNGLKSHNKQKFSVRDRDNDAWPDYHCANEWEGGWWFTNCWSSYLNGAYYNTSKPPYNGISWREWKEEQLLKSEIKILPFTDTLSDLNDETIEEHDSTGEEEADENTDESTNEQAQQDEARYNYRKYQGVIRKRNRAV